MPCTEVDFSDKAQIIELLGGAQRFKSLYCLEDYREYELGYPADDGIGQSSLELTFEFCSESGTKDSVTKDESSESVSENSKQCKDASY